MDPESLQPGAPSGMMPPMPPAGMPPEGMPPMPMGMPEGMPTSDQNPPIEESAAPAQIGDSKNNGLKKQLLQKLMSNLLGKPGRSVNEMINGVKAVIGAYKSYSRELDLLSGGGEGGMAPMEGPPAGSGSSEDIQSILKGIQDKKGAVNDGGGGPGFNNQQMPPIPPTTVPTQVNRPPGNQLGIWGY